jgi:methyl-accepting chemotaxis protein
MFFLALSGSGWTIWWKIDGKVEKVKTEAAEKIEELRTELQESKEELAAHKLHTAERYVAKDSLKETTEQIMGAINGVKAAVENMTLRVDRIVENQNKPTRSRSS